MIIGILHVRYGYFVLSTSKKKHRELKVNDLVEALQVLEDEGWEYHYTLEHEKSKQMVFKQKTLGNPYR